MPCRPALFTTAAVPPNTPLGCFPQGLCLSLAGGEDIGKCVLPLSQMKDIFEEGPINGQPTRDPKSTRWFTEASLGMYLALSRQCIDPPTPVLWTGRTIGRSINLSTLSMFANRLGCGTMNAVRAAAEEFSEATEQFYRRYRVHAPVPPLAHYVACCHYVRRSLMAMSHADDSENAPAGISPLLDALVNKPLVAPLQRATSLLRLECCDASELKRLTKFHRISSADASWELPVDLQGFSHGVGTRSANTCYIVLCSNSHIPPGEELILEEAAVLISSTSPADSLVRALW